MKVGRAVYSADGRVLLNAGVVLRETYLAHLKRLGVPAIYVQSELAPDVAPPDVLQEKTRQVVTKELKTFLGNISGSLGQTVGKSARAFGAADVSSLRSALGLVVDELASNPQALLHLQDIRTADEYTLGHSIGVCVLSVMVGVTMGLDKNSLRDLGLGAVLHDLGKIRVPPEILNKPGPLTPDEMKIMQAHTTWGFEILSAQREVSYHSAHVALQHHERWNGSGYPRGLKGEAIHPYARIVAVADVYDAMVADRVYRPGFAPERALRVLSEICHDFFDPKVYAAFVVNIAKYPVGSVVELNDGHTAVVVEVTKGMADRPRVRVVRDPTGHLLAHPYEVDLAREPQLFIRGEGNRDGLADAKEIIATA
jgi:HD-GYP domain-containing protein (c-di-GMP phosphodiesterase class II)